MPKRDNFEYWLFKTRLITIYGREAYAQIEKACAEISTHTDKPASCLETIANPEQFLSEWHRHRFEGDKLEIGMVMAQVLTAYAKTPLGVVTWDDIAFKVQEALDKFGYDVLTPSANGIRHSTNRFSTDELTTASQAHSF